MQSQDTVSAFNLVGLPVSWTPCFTFGLQVPASVHGGDANVMEDVGFVQSQWDGWAPLSGSKMLLGGLCFAWLACRRGVNFSRAVLPVAEPISVTCLDGCNFMRKVQQGDMSDSAEHERHVAACADLKNPLTSAKGVVHTAVTPLLGGEIHSRTGVLGQSVQKTAR